MKRPIVTNMYAKFEIEFRKNVVKKKFLLVLTHNVKINIKNQI